MDIDDIPIGRVLSRREALAFLGASGGSQLVLDVTGTADGYAATFNIALDTV